MRFRQFVKLFETGDSEPAFFSALQRILQTMPQNKAPGPQWANMIGNLTQKGVRQSEVMHSGVLPWLRQNPGAVTKQQILQYLSQTQPQVSTVIHGPSRDQIAPDATAQQQYAVHWQAVLDAIHAEEAQPRPNVDKIDELRSQLDRMHEQMVTDTIQRRGYSGQGPSYQQYTLPGGKDYRELLLTVPVKSRGELRLGQPVKTDLRWHGQHLVQDCLHYPFTLGKLEGSITYWPVTYGWRGQPEKPQWVVNSAFLQNAHYDSLEEAQQAIIDAVNRPENVDRTQNFRSNHWNEPNVVAHSRFDTRVDAKGRPTLHVAELQSDWHQAGRQHGYKDEPTDIRWQDSPSPNVKHAFRDNDELGSVRNLGSNQWRASYGSTVLGSNYDSEDAARQALVNRHEQTKVASGPFRKDWPMLALKRILRYAVENGFDRVTWDVGDTHTKRFDLRSSVSELAYAPEIQNLYAFGKKGTPIIDKVVPPDQLAKYIGKDLATRLLAEPVGRYQGFAYPVHTLKGAKLKVGGEGMKTFYDEMLPSMAQKYIKRWGGRVAPTKVATTPGANGKSRYSPAWELTITPQMKEAILQGQALWESVDD